MSDDRSATRRVLAALAPLGLFALAVAVRGISWRQVFTDDGVFFVDSDSWYHLRRIVHAIANFPAVLEFDRYINYPEGARPIWSPLFDWAVAAAALPLAPDVRAAPPSALARVEVLAAWIPPVLGGACVAAAWAIARRHLGSGVAWASALILCLLSAHVWYSQVGFVDHHAAVALLATLALGAAMALAEARAGPRAAGARLAVGAGLAFAACLLLWPGSLLHVGLLEGGLVACLVARRDAADARALSLRFAAANGVAALAVLPFTWAQQWPQWGPSSPLVLSRFQPWLFGLLTAFGLAHAHLCRAPGGARRAAKAAGVGIALLLAGALLLPGLASGIADAWSWIARAEGFQSQVLESEPLLVSAGRLGPGPALNRLGVFALVLPAALAWAAHRERRRPAVLLLLAFAAGLLLATLAQKRFFNSLAVPFSMVMGWTLHTAYAATPARWRERAAARRALAAALAAAALLMLLPTFGAWRIPLRNELRAWRGEGAAIWRVSVRQRRSIETARWLRDHTPPTSGWLDGATVPEYGVLAPWALGHTLEYVARRPTVTDAFGDDLGRRNWDLAQRYYQSGEAEAAGILDRLNARYVVASHHPGFLERAPEPGSMFYSLYFFDGGQQSSLAAVRSHPTPEPLRRHRLLYESPPRQGMADDGPSSFKVFEYVAGASIEGRAAPGARVRLSLPLRSNRGRPLDYTDEARAGPDGRYAFRVPYANQGTPPSTGVGRSYSLACDGESAEVRVREDQVREGTAVTAPDLCPGAPPERR